MIRCRDCAVFIPDKIGDGYGIGRCKAYEQYKRAGESTAALKARLIELGNSPDSTIFWGGGCLRIVNVTDTRLKYEKSANRSLCDAVSLPDSWHYFSGRDGFYRYPGRD